MLRSFLLVSLLVIAAPVAAGQDIRFTESFDAATEPDLPEGWSGDWVTSTSSASSGSGQNNLADVGTGTATVLSPAFSLVGLAGAQLTYLARRTSSYPAEAVAVVFSTGAGEFTAAGSGLPEASSSWELVTITVPEEALGQAEVRIRFVSSGGTSSGSNARIDDVAVTATGAAPTGGQFGFQQAQVDVLSGSGGVLVPLYLVWSGTESLQGLQFTLTVSDPAVSITGLQRGASLSDLSEWTLSREGNEVLLISNSTGGLEAGTYAPLMSSVVDVGEVVDTTEVTLSVESLVGAMALPAGTDAGLVGLPASSVLRILPRVGVFEAPDTLDLGAVPVGDSVEGTLWLRNTGTADLGPSAVTTDHAAFAASPSSVTVPAGDSVLVTVTFQPGAAQMEGQVGHLVVEGTSRTVLLGSGLAIWGDATDDGLVDVGDIVLGVDVALGRVAGSADVVQRLDLYPFPEGDGAVDVRDLTVLTQAVLRGEWPGAIPLPQSGAAKSGALAQGAAVLFRQTEGQLEAVIASGVRGVQAEFLVAGEVLRSGEALVQQQGDSVRVLWVRMDGSELPEGVAVIAQGAFPELRGGVAIGSGGERLSVTMEDLPADMDLSPFPNPFRPDQHHALRIPANGPVIISNMLGRVVWRGEGSWDGRDRSGRPVASGVYSVGRAGRVHQIVVIR